MRNPKNYKFINVYLPVMLEQTLATFSTMLGTMLVSQLGEETIAGIGMVDQLNFLFMNVLVCIATGVTAIVSQRVGSGNVKEAQNAACNAVTLALYTSVAISFFLVLFRDLALFTLFGRAEQAVLDSASEYFFFTSVSLPFLALLNIFAGIRRATGDNLSPLIGALLSNVCYVLIALFCMNVLHLGISSIGFGLLFSRIISSSVVYMFIRLKPRSIKITKIPLKPDFDTLKPVLNIAVPNAMDSLIFNGGKVIVQVFISGMGTASMTANTIMSSIMNLVQLPGKTFSVTAVPVTGTAYGSGDMEKTKKVMLNQVWLCNLSEVAMNIFFYIFCEGIYGMYTDDPEILTLTRNLVMAYLIISPFFWSTSFLTPSTLRATGDAKFTMKVSVFSLFAFRVLFSWILGVKMEFGIYGVWASMYMDWIFRSIFYFSRIFSSKWHMKKDIEVNDLEENVEVENLEEENKESEENMNK